MNRVRRLLPVLIGVGVLGFTAWVLRDPAFDPEDAASVRQWLEYDLGRNYPEPLRLTELHALSDGRYEGEAIDSAGHVARVRIEPAGRDAQVVIDASNPAPGYTSTSSLTAPPFGYRHPDWANLFQAMLGSVLLFSGVAGVVQLVRHRGSTISDKFYRVSAAVIGLLLGGWCLYDLYTHPVGSLLLSRS
jgi:hypothetical protein